MTGMRYSYREFAKMTHTTLRTLRYYESVGLIVPTLCHDKKYIEDHYFVVMQTIQLLKRAGYTLAQIKHILHDKNIEDQIIMQKDLLNIQLTNTKVMLSLIDEMQKDKDMDIYEIYKKFLQIQNRKNLQLQFETPDGLKTRIKFHHLHTHFDHNFHEWIFEHIIFHQNDHILEIGCGDGTLWDCNRQHIPKDITVILSDISQEMVKDCYKRLYDIPQIVSFDVADCFCLPYEDESFDIIIMNHVLMYLEHLDLALKEIQRVLKPGGLLYCTTIAHDMLKERDKMLKRFDPKISFHQEILYNRFGYENGKEKLQQYFEDIELFDRKEIYEITDMDFLYQFILSGKGLSNDLEILYRKKREFYNYLKNIFSKNKVFQLTVHTGMFQAKKEEKS